MQAAPGGARRPNRLRVLMPGDGPPSEFYYDGSRMVAFSPEAGLAAVADAPPTIDAMLKAAFDKAGAYVRERHAFGSSLLDEPTIRFALADMATGLEHVHESGFMHLDFKPENVLVTRNASVRVADFDLALPIPAKPANPY